MAETRANDAPARLNRERSRREKHSCCMAGHHDAAVHNHIGSFRALLLAETDRLVSSVVGGSGGGGIHATTVKAVGDFLISFNGEGTIPWARLYDSFPSWQQRSGLLNEAWDRDEDLHKAKVIFTLITADGKGAINRKALGAGGNWEIKSGGKIGHDVLLRKLYLKNGGSVKWSSITMFEFHLKMDLKSPRSPASKPPSILARLLVPLCCLGSPPAAAAAGQATLYQVPHRHTQTLPRVAICVLHPTNYRHVIRDLKNYVLEGDFPGRNQANLQVEQYQDPPCDAGFRNGQHVDHTTIPASNSERDILGANQADQMAVQHEGHYLVHNVARFGNATLFNYTANPVSNSETSYGQPSIRSSQEAPPPQAFLDGLCQFLFSEEPDGQHSHADEMAIFNVFYNLL
ncbi:uncharacterized protein [Triticum aestivum]|uniref:uncharacterized protein n=1 Tax=Triticum aestivum TaxID=4565 RepID=UPI001D026EAC|nr:uncharacterized protein LOC123094112 [Triticum aestivum]